VSHPGLHHTSIYIDCLCDDVAASGTTSCQKKDVQTISTKICLVKKSCWYVNYLKLRETVELTYDLSSSDQFGEFRAWFQMPDEKAHCKRVLATTMLYASVRGIYKKMQTLSHANSLYFGSLIYPFTHTSATKIEKFFHRFLDKFMDMQDEHISMPQNLTALTKILK